ncbi:MAG: IS1634 family transposase, partial [Enterovibrio sp.]
QGLVEQGRYVADMKKKPTQKPTARWIFLRFGGIHEYRLGAAPPQVTGLTADQQIIIDVLGEPYRQIYS